MKLTGSTFNVGNGSSSTGYIIGGALLVAAIIFAMKK
jgi:hypothetical protein